MILSAARLPHVRACDDEHSCNSTVRQQSKTKVKSYRYCHLFDKGMYLSATTKNASECPYKECIHRVSLEPPESEPQAADVAEVVPVAMEEELPRA